MSNVDKIKNERCRFITRISKKRGWDFSDNNPYWSEVYELMPKINAETLRDYKKQLKLERKKYEKVAMYNAVRTRLCV